MLQSYTNYFNLANYLVKYCKNTDKMSLNTFNYRLYAF